MENPPSSSGPGSNASTYPQKEEKSKLWGILLFGVIGATATTLAIGQLKKSREWFHHVPFTRSGTVAKGSSGTTYRTASQEDAWKRYNRRIQEEFEEEMERVERIRRMQSVLREASIQRDMRHGQKISRMHILKTFSATTGIGRLTIISEIIKELIIGNLLDQMQATHYHIITLHCSRPRQNPDRAIHRFGNKENF